MRADYGEKRNISVSAERRPAVSPKTQNKINRLGAPARVWTHRLKVNISWFCWRRNTVASTASDGAQSAAVGGGVAAVGAIAAATRAATTTGAGAAVVIAGAVITSAVTAVVAVGGAVCAEVNDGVVQRG